MANCFVVDSKGKRIMTDILVSGCMHGYEKKYHCTIPEELFGLIFMFWFIQYCDIWDQSLSHDSVGIDGQSAAVTSDVGVIFSMYGSKSIKQGIYEWKIRFNTVINWICIGIVKDEIEALKKYKADGVYATDGDGVCLFLTDYTLAFVQGKIYFNDNIKPTINKDTVITMILNMDERKISYKADDTNVFEKALTIAGDKYRLVVTLMDGGCELELL